MAKGAGNSGKLQINTNFFTGGVSISNKLGVANSFYKSRNLDFRSDPAQMSVLPAPSALSTTLSDLPLAIDQDLNGVRWMVGDKGYIYKVDTSNVISVVGEMSEAGSAGLLYNQVTDQLYIPGQTKVSMYGQVTTGNPGQPIFRNGTFAQSVSINNGTTQIYDPLTGNFDGALRSVASTSSGTTYPVPTTLTETSGQFCVFSPDIEPGYSISVFISVKGTGDYTLTLHDSQNNPLASTTITNANIVAGQLNEFVFGSQIRVLVGGGIASGAANYHWHLTSTATGATIAVVPLSYGSSATGDFMSAYMTWSAYRLVQTANGWHPTALFNVATGTGNGQALCIGNGQYLSTYNFSNDGSPDNNSWIRHQLVFKTGYEVCGLSTNNNQLVIAVERRSKNASRNFQDGALYFWDGTTPQPTSIIDMPMGAPYGLTSIGNVTYFTVAGSLYAWSGGTTVIKVRKIAYQNTDYLGVSDSTIVNPNMFTSRYNILLLGYPSSSTNVNIDYGIWSWGAVEITFPNSFGYSYQQSHGFLNNNTSGISNLKIGMNQNFVDTLYTSWSYTEGGVTTYGIDILDNNSTAATSGTWESLIFDGGSRFKQKYANRVKVSFTPLPAGAIVTPYYKLNRGAKVSQSSVNTTNATDALIEINQRCHEISYGFDFTMPIGLTIPPDFTGITLEIDPTQSEVDVTSDN
jgi:hypothetical protein